MSTMIHLKEKIYCRRQGRVSSKLMTLSPHELVDRLNSHVVKDNHLFEELGPDTSRRFRCILDGALGVEEIYDAATSLGLSFTRSHIVVGPQTVIFPGIVFANRNVEAAFARRVKGINHTIYDTKIQY
eukprot:CAMPEP_0203769292 /NCGR_PEP_ID=MMETSP0099_2-20121227/2101_1 /ASSEMBLY_ACC=CAM_ASM_000209 /TAXON_ID=96639 /ORGANISM=" , Strain NY0313808BC1" /LENGTH=127 /DNA_ID=CAMNT_0050666155 /DNA_START=154 /DNA_END=534 /DNA_ORIENTATION=+